MDHMDFLALELGVDSFIRGLTSRLVTRKLPACCSLAVVMCLTGLRVAVLLRFGGKLVLPFLFSCTLQQGHGSWVRWGLRVLLVVGDMLESGSNFKVNNYNKNCIFCCWAVFWFLCGWALCLIVTLLLIVSPPKRTTHTTGAWIEW